MPWLLRPLASAIAKGVQSYLGPQIRQHVAFMEAAQARGFINARQSRLLAWLPAIHAHPAYQRTLAQRGPYSLLR